jgi:hypothetical protein
LIDNTAGLFTANGSTITVSGPVSFTGGVELANAAGLTVSTDGSAASDISFGSFVRSNSTTARPLSLQAGAAGSVTIDGLAGGGPSVGSDKLLSALTVNTTVDGSGAISLNGVYTTGAQTYGASGATGSITLGADGAAVYRSVSVGDLAFYGPVVLDNSGGTIVVQSAGVSGDDILFDKSLNGTTAGEDDLSLIAGSGDINVTGIIGGTTRLGVISIPSANNVTFTGDITAASLSQSPAGTGTTTFDGPLDFNTATACPSTQRTSQSTAP